MIAVHIVWPQSYCLGDKNMLSESSKLVNALSNKMNSVFDREFDMFNILDKNFSAYNTPTFPHYNLTIVDENTYRIDVALAGYSKDELDITLDGTLLTISGKKSEDTSYTENKEEKYPKRIHNGIAKRNFYLKFKVIEGSKVINPKFENGLLTLVVLKPKPADTKVKINIE